ncbi:putative dynein light chain [Schistosoma japonicum]|uniref:Dynein light chain n=1 Tax=Schistosoma japonicum TaxID=6182 RepID=A0A4Z2D614_SCHJA|nr:putative dynein light chain [Schistosoma japonicum]
MMSYNIWRIGFNLMKMYAKPSNQPFSFLPLQLDDLKHKEPFSCTCKIRTDILVVKCDIQDEMRNYAEKLVKKAVNRYESERDIATFIKGRFDSHYEKYWQCIVGKHFDSSLEMELSQYILLRVNDIYILLFRYN